MNQATSILVTHCGARTVTRDELDRIAAPPPTRTWFPVGHSAVIDSVARTLAEAGFEARSTRLAVARGDARMFATLDLATPLGEGVALAVGIRNSTDKSLPLGFCAGLRVFVCDNLAFRSELLVARKHTRFGRDRFGEAIALAVGSLARFREQEAARIERLRAFELTDQAAESYMLRAFERGVVSHRLLPVVIRGWREPAHEEFRGRTGWSLYNAFTAALHAPLEDGPPAARRPHDEGLGAHRSRAELRGMRRGADRAMTADARAR